MTKLKKAFKKYQTSYAGKNGFIKAIKEITYQQFLFNLEYQLLTGRNFKEGNDPEIPDLTNIYQRER